MTFPSYRVLLAQLGSAARDAQGNLSIACAATAGGQPAGLVIAQVPAPTEAVPSPEAEILSIFVDPDQRGKGIGTALVACLEGALAARGVRGLMGVYMTGRPSIPALERIFEKRAFAPPERRTVVVRCTPEEVQPCDWYRKARMPDGATVFPWSELTGEERAWLQSSQKERNWIHPELEPWRFDKHCHQLSSVGMRKDGEVVGWVINHLIAKDMVRFTVSFMRYDLARRGAIFPLYVESMERMKGKGLTCTFVTASYFEPMVRFVQRRVQPFVSFVGETRGVSKALAAAEGAGAAAP
jgi:GNAT superfamily N-acetyltransferase